MNTTLDSTSVTVCFVSNLDRSSNIYTSHIVAVYNSVSPDSLHHVCSRRQHTFIQQPGLAAAVKRDTQLVETVE